MMSLLSSMDARRRRRDLHLRSLRRRRARSSRQPLPTRWRSVERCQHEGGQVLCFQVRNALALGVVAAAVEGFASAGAFAGGAFHHGGAALRAKDGDFIGGRLPGGARVRVHPLSLEITDCDFKIRFLS